MIQFMISFMFYSKSHKLNKIKINKHIKKNIFQLMLNKYLSKKLKKLKFI